MPKKKKELSEHERIIKLEKITSELQSILADRLAESGNPQMGQDQPFVVQNYNFPSMPGAISVKTTLTMGHCDSKEIYRNGSGDQMKDVRLDFTGMHEVGQCEVFSAPHNHQGAPRGHMRYDKWERGDSGLTQPHKVKSNESLFVHFSNYGERWTIKLSWTVT